MGLGGVAIAVPPYVIHPKTAVLGRAGGGSVRKDRLRMLMFLSFEVVYKVSALRSEFQEN